ncbi:MAG: iron-containing alcohol dehydrogenase [Fusobacteriaceae bacterium]|jgi:alcohol dehydrogenase|nr:iron-containing alcohol dehydrogenase [Fusobacteriaceae bacterium]
MKFKYFIPTKILFGRGQLGNLHKEQLPGKKALIVMSSGKSAKTNGYLEKLTKELELSNVEYLLYDKILPNPIKTHVDEGGKLAKEKKCDFVIGLGGGSSIDAAKAIAIMATNDGDYWDYVNGGSGKGKPVPNDPLPIVAITTTAGTGTESDPWTVTTKLDTNEKIGYGYEKTFPVLSIVDPELMITVPPHLTAYQGFDALFHSTEGYINKNAYIVSDIYALKAIELIGSSLITAVNDGKNIDARENVALANTLSGMVETTSGCISEHSLEHALSAFHPELPHGAGLIMISREYYTYFAKIGACDAKFIDMAKALGKKDATKPMDFVDLLVDLQKACHVDNLKMSDYGIKKENLKKYLANARETMGRLFQVDPAPLGEEDALKILENSYK